MNKFGARATAQHIHTYSSALLQGASLAFHLHREHELCYGPCMHGNGILFNKRCIRLLPSLWCSAAYLANTSSRDGTRSTLARAATSNNRHHQTRSLLLSERFGECCAVAVPGLSGTSAGCLQFISYNFFRFSFLSLQSF